MHVTGKTLRMTSASRSALDAFLQAAGVQVVLSGHTHKAHAGPVAKVQELCSASTTQIDEAPAGWVNIYGGPPTVTFERNGFLVHRLHDDSGAVRWDVHVMLRGPQGTGFVQAALHQFRI
jgi:predicted phosphodiesterase